MTNARRSRLLIQAYTLGIPLWWILGLDFITFQLLAFVLVCFAGSAHRYFRLSDHILLAIVLALGLSAFLNGFLLSHEMMRFVAALYNLSFWICGLVFVQQVRYLLQNGELERLPLLRAGYWAFMSFVAVSSGAVAIAFLTGRYSLDIPSVFGTFARGGLPNIIESSTNLEFTQSDWGGTGLWLPRVKIYGPYPTATGATVTVFGTLALLYLIAVRHASAFRVLLTEVLLFAAMISTLTRSIIGGWILGYIAANLIFGSPLRRIGAFAAIVAGVLIAGQADLSGVLHYRQYSSEGRFENYATALARTVQTHPVLGLGIKPRETHIPLGSHSTFVSAFTKGGTLTLCLVIIYFVVIPACWWFSIIAAPMYSGHCGPTQAELRILFNLQVATWMWLCFEDIDAPATACMLLFVGLAFIESAYLQRRAELGRLREIRVTAEADPAISNIDEDRRWLNIVSRAQHSLR